MPRPTCYRGQSRAAASVRVRQEEYPYGDAGIQQLTSPYWESLFHHKVGVTLGARNLDQVINAYEAAQRQS